MNLFRRNGKQPDAAVQQIPYGRCPKCQGVEVAVVAPLMAWAMTPTGVQFAQVGARLSCQRCPHVFSVGPSGAFDHEPTALPSVARETIAGRR